MHTRVANRPARFSSPFGAGFGGSGFAGGRFNDLALIAAPSVGVVLTLPWLSSLQVRSRALRLLAARVGDYSYSVYLSHFPLLLIMVYVFKVMGWDIGAIIGWVVLVWLMAVFAVSALVFHSFEKPVSDLRERFTKRVQAGPFSRGEV